jgi:hypothetical protein
MKNLTEYNDFKELKRGTTEKVTEGAQIFDNEWKVRTRVTIPTSLINAYIKKVEAETGEKCREKWSDQELAEEITKYVSTAFMTVENLPSSIVTNVEQKPQVQVQEEMPVQTQVQTQVEEPEVQVEEAPAGQEVVQSPEGQVQSQTVAQEIPQSQPKPQVQGGQPAQEI